MSKLLVLTVGHIAAGKTTLLRAIHRELDAVYISEGSIKRQLVIKAGHSYHYTDSLSEDLRDAGYKEAIRQMVEGFWEHDIVLMDASFHRQFRRDWVMAALRENGLLDIDILILWLFCSDEGEVERRVKKRAAAEIKNADNQADNMEVYRHIQGSFDPVDLSKLPEDLRISMIAMDTYQNKIVREQIAATQCTALEWIRHFLKEEYAIPRHAASF